MHTITQTLATTIKGTGNAPNRARLIAGFALAVLLPQYAATGAQAPVVLGTAGNYVILAKSGISTVPPPAVVGALGTSPIFAVNDSPSYLLPSGQLAPVGPPPSLAGWYEYAVPLDWALARGDPVTVSAGSGAAIIDRLTLVLDPASMIAAAIVLIPFAFSTWPILSRRRKQNLERPRLCLPSAAKAVFHTNPCGDEIH